MPFIIPLLPTLLTAVSAVGAGVGLVKSLTSSTPDYSKQLAAQQQQNDAQKMRDAQGLEQQKSALLRRTAPDAQSATGGSLSPDAFAAFTSILAGLPGDSSLASKVLNGGGGSGFGGFGSNFGATAAPGGGSSGLVNSPGLEELSSSLSGGQVSGGGPSGSGSSSSSPFDLNSLAYSGGY